MVKIVSEALDAIRSAHLERAREDNDYGHVESCEFAVEEAAEEFDRMIAEIERTAAGKAWDRCVGEMPIDPDWKNFYLDNNPYRAEAYRQGDAG